MRKRSPQVKGKFEDSGKYVRCRRCGFHIDTTKEVTEMGSRYFLPDAISPRLSGDPMLVNMYFDNYDMVGSMQELGGDGLAKTDYYEPRRAIVCIGKVCPFCGIKSLP
jgi:hypothetical protein